MRQRCLGGGVGYQHCNRFWNAIKKYGWKNFEHIVLIDGLSLEMANLLEEELIRKYNSTNDKIGYNISYGGRNSARSPESIAKYIKSATGKKRSLEARKRISEGHKNPSEETRRKISESNRRRKVTDRQRRLASERFIGNRYRAKAIIQYGIDGKFIKKWECAKDVERELGIDHGNIGKCCNFNAPTAGGYQWRYDEGNYNDINPIDTSRKRKVNQYDTNMNYIKTWDSASDAEKEKGFRASNIRKSCVGKDKTAYGYIWRYVDEELENII